ncbi:MAG TPA: hypothetical protein VHZ55_19670 [Bryobacteraceae bacterium]|jgi:hypothetical protein|nr:hypothetical protein [Bryobacteraceae bacterium]
MKWINPSGIVIACCCAVITVGVFYAQTAEDTQERDLAPNGRGIGTEFAHGPSSHRSGPMRLNKSQKSASGNGIYYHGGPLLGIAGAPSAYLIWYGNWSGNTATSILTNFVLHVGGSPYFNINTTYYDGTGNYVTNAIRYGGTTTDNYSHGTALSDSAVQAVVAQAISSGKLPTDPDGVYFVLTSKDVDETSGFCTSYCGWHTYGTISGSNIKYAFIGNGDRCPSACEEQTKSPNGNSGADGMASVLAHELEEAVTDPNLNAWYDRRGEENADKCAWTFGATSTANNGSMYNMILNGKPYLIQQNWVNASGGYCAMSY